jgi:uncharacterized membrane protein YgdD (TMEM256/DUF423 family)
MPMHRMFAALAGVSGFLAVAMGAFGAHAVRARITPELMAVYERGAQYHLFHTLALLGVALLAARGASSLLKLSGWMFVAGIVIFSGSLYALALSGQRWLGMITPFGGVSFLLGWLLLAFGALQQDRSPASKEAM